MHPPPVNYLTCLLLFSVFKDALMLRSSEMFSRMIFWLENLVFYIPKMLIYELLLIPFIYLRLIYNILRVEDNRLNALLLVLIWILIGVFYLLYYLVVDMLFYFKILYDYHDNETSGAEQAREDRQ